MQFPYIDISFIYEEVKSVLKTMNIQGLINDDDCRAWAFTAIRLIGCNNFEDETVSIRIKNNNGFIPKDFYVLKDIRYEGENEGDNLNAIMRPGDSSTKNLCMVASPCMGEGDFMYTFTIKNPPGIIRSDCQNGYITFKYFRIAATANGDPMAQDEENNIQAIKYYIIQNLLFEKMLLGEINQNAYAAIEMKYTNHRSRAEQILKFPEPSSLNYLINQNDNRYSKFKLFR